MKLAKNIETSIFKQKLFFIMFIKYLCFLSFWKFLVFSFKQHLLTLNQYLYD